jgi:hypothetical protein
VTLLAPLLLEDDEPELELALVAGLALVVVVTGLALAAVVAVVVVEAVVAVWRFRASAGSWPLASVITITSQVATNRATAPDTTRRRIIRALCVLVMDGSVNAAHLNTVSDA